MANTVKEDSLFLALLECKHTLYFRRGHVPAKGDTLWCRRCEKERTVSEPRYEFRVRCEGCTYGRMAGSSKIAAESLAIKHGKRKRHNVRVYVADVVVSAFHFVPADSGDVPLF